MDNTAIGSHPSTQFAVFAVHVEGANRVPVLTNRSRAKTVPVMSKHESRAAIRL